MRTARRWVPRRVRTAVGLLRRWWSPPPAEAAWRRACRAAEGAPRRAAGRIRLLDYDVDYPDLVSLCPQWESIFVRGALDFESRDPAPRILDCGANVGLATLYFKRRYPRARISAYEADPAICALLADNLRKNGAGDVEVVNAAVWVAGGTVIFRCEGSDSGAVDGLADDLPGPRQAVPSVRLRDLLAREPVDLLKLDIEGAEAAVLEDCADVLGRVGALVAELHEFDPGRRRMAGVLDLLGRAGFDYALDDLTPASWREPAAPAGTPFARRPLGWVCLVRAWRP